MADKSMADVADKAVDKLAQVADAIGRLAPGIWESAVRSERVEGIVNVVLMIALCVLCVFQVRKFLAVLAVEQAKDFRDPELTVIWGLVAAIALCVAIGVTSSNLGTELSRAVSPEYYAAHALLGAVK